ncbi:MAG: hypothetical protein JWO38_2512 [Gemmataceae bacterium]|nr:hypothetical protein [Gemmataceae bacterium]
MPTPPPLPWISASVPKIGHAPAENEDATAAFPAKMRFAAADGATEGWQSGGWARHVATAYVRRPPAPADFPDWLAAVRRDWKPPAARGATAWYAEAKSEQGSFTTLVGVEIRRLETTPGFAWKAVAVGDSCLLVARGGRFEVAFPLSAAADFGSRPALVPSSPEVRCPEPEWLAGRAEPGDLLLLATDAVARHLLGLNTPAALAAVLSAARDDVASGRPDQLIKLLLSLNNVLNDDASVVAVRVPDPPESHR